MKKAPIQVWHSLEISTILQGLHADAGQGLSNDEARRRSAKYGPNQSTVSRGKAAEAVSVAVSSALDL
jgi:hypothetical protein